MARPRPSDGDVSNPRFWVFCIRQQNWPACRAGPDDAGIHRDNVGSPWQGLGENSNFDPTRLRRGDVVVARRTYRGGNEPHGAMGVWRYHDRTPVDDPSEVPWTDDRYRWMLYCRDVQTLARPIHEPFDDVPFHQNKFHGAVNALTGRDRRAYIDLLLQTGRLNGEATGALRDVR